MPWLRREEEEMREWLPFPYLPLQLCVWLLLAEGQENTGGEEEESGSGNGLIIALSVTSIVLVGLLILILCYLRKRIITVKQARLQRQEYIRRRAREASAMVLNDDTVSQRSKDSSFSTISKSKGSVHFSEADTVWDPLSPVLRVYQVKRNSNPTTTSKRKRSNTAYAKPLKLFDDSVFVGSRRTVQDIAKEYQSPPNQDPGTGNPDRKISMSLHPRFQGRRSMSEDIVEIQHGHLLQRRLSWRESPTQSILRAPERQEKFTDRGRYGSTVDRFMVDRVNTRLGNRNMFSDSSGGRGRLTVDRVNATSGNGSVVSDASDDGNPLREEGDKVTAQSGSRSVCSDSSDDRNSTLEERQRRVDKRVTTRAQPGGGVRSQPNTFRKSPFVLRFSAKGADRESDAGGDDDDDDDDDDDSSSGSGCS